MSKQSIEALIVHYLNTVGAVDGFPVSTLTPANASNRARFITVERTGSKTTDRARAYTFTTLVYAPTQVEAAATADMLDESLQQLSATVHRVTRVDVLTVANSPDPDPPYRNRYLINFQIHLTL